MTEPRAHRPAAITLGATPAPALSAATVVLFRSGRAGLEVLLTRRPSTMAFGPDIHVFPGGRVEAADLAAAAAAGGLATPGNVGPAALTADLAAERLGLGIVPGDGLTPEDALALHLAAVRETDEETGIRLEPDALVHLTRWVTPVSMPRRFDVRFFAAEVPTETEVMVAAGEVTEHRWLTPAAAIEAAIAGDISLWQPTLVTLEQLDGLAGIDGLRAAFAPGTERGGPRRHALAGGITRVDGVWAAGIPGRRSPTWLLGRREITVVNPGDPTGVSSDAIQAWVDEAGQVLAGVVVTSLAPEHHAGVELLAHGLGLPVAGPRGAAGRAPYPLTELDPADPLPFGDAGLNAAAIDRLVASAVPA